MSWHDYVSHRLELVQAVDCVMWSCHSQSYSCDCNNFSTVANRSLCCRLWSHVNGQTAHWFSCCLWSWSWNYPCSSPPHRLLHRLHPHHLLLLRSSPAPSQLAPDRRPSAACPARPGHSNQNARAAAAHHRRDDDSCARKAAARAIASEQTVSRHWPDPATALAAEQERRAALWLDGPAVGPAAGRPGLESRPASQYLLGRAAAGHPAASWAGPPRRCWLRFCESIWSDPRSWPAGPLRCSLASVSPES